MRLALSLVGGLALIAAGCGEDSSAATNPSPSSETTASVVSSQASEADEPAASSIDGFVVRYPVRSNDDYGMGAEINGTLVLDGQCLYVEVAELGERFPLLWPAGTAWDEGSQSVVPPTGAAIPVGQNVRGGGGYLKVSDVERLASSEAASAVESCVDNDYAEIAVLNNQDSAIALDPS